MDELRTAVWDLLYRTQEPKSIEEIAEQMGQEVPTIQAVVEHEWFSVDGGVVTISHGTTTA